MSGPALRRSVLVLAAVALLILAVLLRKSQRTTGPVSGTNALAILIEHEARQATQHWSMELRAQKFGAVVDQLWNRINASTNKLAVLSEFEPELMLPQFANAVRQDFPHGIRLMSPHGGNWRELLNSYASAGWVLERCEFRHNAFFTNQMGRGLASSYYVSGHLVNARAEERAIVEGNVMLWWNERPDLPPIRTVDARQLKVRLRSGAVPFVNMFHQEVSPPQGSYFIDPIIIWDLDKDGASELILAAKNIFYRRESTGAWLPAPLLEGNPGLILAAMIGDFNGNGTSDFAFANFDGVFVCEGKPEGGFAAARLSWAAEPRLKYPQVMSAGDVDKDGDLDLFLGQYKVPYDRGQMPFPYFDANDGYPSFLLINDGQGGFLDGTAAAGLAAKRGRRVYSASLADVNGDADLDLLVVSDFAGLDAYENDGSGRFTDVTRNWFAEPYGFGMAHAFTDFNADGFLDLTMVAMNSPTADRLASLRATRPYDVPDKDMRSRATYGNRMFFGQPDGTFRQTPLSDHVARTGWSWGVAAADFDNDGLPDLYLANGHETRESVQEYEPEFWLHDIYVGNSRENSLAHAYFRDKYARTRGRGYSYGGYEKNRFFLNIGGTNVLEVAHLFGLGLEQDSRNVVAEDFNGDGKLDLVVTTFEAWPVVRQTVRIFENRLPNTGNWLSLAIDLRARFFGASVEAGKGRVAVLATGDSYRVQRPLKVHLGLGKSAVAPTVRIRTTSGAVAELRGLEVNRMNHPADF